MESLRLLLLSGLLCILDFDLSAGKLQIFSGGGKLILKSSKCNKCLIVPRGYSKVIDPGNTLIEKTNKEFAAISKKCSKGDFTRIMGPFLNRASKWCGDKDDKDLKKCCQERLKCPVKLERSLSKSNSKGFLSPLLSCDCEKKFGICLKNVGNDEAKKVFRFQFHLFPGSCMKYDHPIHCVFKGGNVKADKVNESMKCTIDKKKPKKWQMLSRLTGRPEVRD